LSALIETLHHDLHKTIYADVRDDLISERQVSVLLNINRELVNSNQALLAALAGYLLAEPALEVLELAGRGG
jgi:hypothetical protein